MNEKDKLEKVRLLEINIHNLERDLLEKKAALLKMDAIEDNDERVHELEKEIEILSSHSICTSKEIPLCCNNESSIFIADSILYEIFLKEYKVDTKDIKETLKLIPSVPHIEEVLCKELKNFAINIRKNLIAELKLDNDKCLADIDSVLFGDN